MKRAPLLVLAGTVAGFVGVLTFHTRPVSATLPGSTKAVGSPSATSTSTSAPRATPAPTHAAPTNAAAGGSPVRSAAGQAVQFGYGVLDVTVTVTGTHITGISVTDLQTAEPTSQQISEQAIPMLRSEVLSAQSANVNGISGATFTSRAYVESLQAALDKLNVK
jgi:uncharacterized protein with FMN-binding domain